MCQGLFHIILFDWAWDRRLKLGVFFVRQIYFIVFFIWEMRARVTGSSGAQGAWKNNLHRHPRLVSETDGGPHGDNEDAPEMTLHLENKNC